MTRKTAKRFTRIPVLNARASTRRRVLFLPSLCGEEMGDEPKGPPGEMGPGVVS